jgi:hypothetical protein
MSEAAAEPVATNSSNNDVDYNEDYVEGEGEEYYGDEQVGEGVDAEQMQKSVEEMEAELQMLTKMQQEVTDQLSSAADKIDEKSM